MTYLQTGFVAAMLQVCEWSSCHEEEGYTGLGTISSRSWTSSDSAISSVDTGRVIEKKGVAVAQKQMRHSDPNATLAYYGDVLGNAQREAVDAIEAETESVFPGK